MNFNVNFKAFPNLIRSAFVGERTLMTLKCQVQLYIYIYIYINGGSISLKFNGDGILP